MEVDCVAEVVEAGMIYGGRETEELEEVGGDG